MITSDTILLILFLVLIYFNYKAFTVGFRCFFDPTKEDQSFKPDYIEQVSFTVSKWALSFCILGAIFQNSVLSHFSLFIAYMNAVIIGIPFLYGSIRVKSRKGIVCSTGSVIVVIVLLYKLYCMSSNVSV